MQDNILMPGDAAGNYDEKWAKTFDLKFLIIWLVLFVFLLTWTVIFDPNLFDARAFFFKTGIKLSIMMLLALGGGMLCRHYCNIDEKGYITTSKNKWFKVNYTRKIQHFAAYLVPSWNLKNRYVRSYAGSACVYIAAVVFLLLFKGQFANPQEFWTSMILFPPIMTLSEAFAPHSMDTPIMMLIGFSLLFGICAIF